MALILKKKEPGYRSWYEKNKQRLSERRKKLFVENPEYRQRVLEASVCLVTAASSQSGR